MKLVDAQKYNSIFILLNDEEIKSLSEGGYPTFDLGQVAQKLPKNVRYLSIIRDNDQGKEPANPSGPKEM